MALSTPIPGQKQRFYAAIAAEATFGANTATITHYFNTLPMPPIRVQQAVVTDAELANGYDGPTTQYPVDRSMAHTVPLWASPEALGIALGYLCGQDTVNSGATPSILHTFTPLAVGSAQYGGTIESHLSGATVDTDTDWKHLGTCVNSVTLSGGGRSGQVRLDIGYQGSGGAADGATRTESSLTTASFFFAANKAKISIKAETTNGATPWGGSYTAPTGAGVFANTLSGGTDLSEHLENWTIKLEAGLSPDRSSGTSSSVGIIGVQPKVLRRRGTAELTWVVDAATKALTKVLFNSTAADNAGYALVLELVGDVAAGGGSKIVGACIVLPLVKFTATPDGQGSIDSWAQDRVSFETHNQTSGTNYGHYRAFVSDGQTAAYCHS